VTAALLSCQHFNLLQPALSAVPPSCFLDKNECGDTENPVCDHICINHQGTYKCDCNVGYSLEVDGRSCKVNGGLIFSLCINTCIVIPHLSRILRFSFMDQYVMVYILWKCKGIYILNVNCILPGKKLYVSVFALDIHPRLLFSNRHEIRAIHIHGQQKYMPLLDSAAAVALDFDYATNKVFYSDMKEKKLYKFTLPGPDEDVDELQEVCAENLGYCTSVF